MISAKMKKVKWIIQNVLWINVDRMKSSKQLINKKTFSEPSPQYDKSPSCDQKFRQNLIW